MIKIPLIHVKDKQAFVKQWGPLRFMGNPVEYGKKLKAEGYKLIHMVDEDALKGMSKNFDVYNAMTYFINVQVECAPMRSMVNKLLSKRCRVVLPHDADFSGYDEKNLLVARLPKGYGGPLEGFHDAILDEADDSSIKRLDEAGKRIMVHESDYPKLSEQSRKRIWGLIEGE